MNYEEERHAEKLLSEGWLTNEQAHALRQRAELAERQLSDARKEVEGARDAGLEECLLALSKQYTDEGSDANCYNAAVGYCIGAILVLKHDAAGS